MAHQTIRYENAGIGAVSHTDRFGARLLTKTTKTIERTFPSKVKGRDAAFNGASP